MIDLKLKVLWLKLKIIQEKGIEVITLKDINTEVEVEEHIGSEEIADYLSNIYGYLVDSFAMPMTNDDRDYFWWVCEWSWRKS